MSQNNTDDVPLFPKDVSQLMQESKDFFRFQQLEYRYYLEEREFPATAARAANKRQAGDLLLEQVQRFKEYKRFRNLKCYLLMLPREIRDKIYEYCLPQNFIFDLTSDLYTPPYNIPFPSGWVFQAMSYQEQRRLGSPIYDLDNEEISRPVYPRDDGQPRFAYHHCVHYDPRLDLQKLNAEHGPFHETNRTSKHWVNMVCDRCWSLLEEKTNVEPNFPKHFMDENKNYRNGFGLLLTCKQIAAEMEDFLYKHNEFLAFFDIDWSTAPSGEGYTNNMVEFCPRNAEKVRHLTVWVDSSAHNMFVGSSDEQPLMRSGFWNLIGPNLRTLKFVVCQDDYPYENEPHLIPRMCKALRPTLMRLLDVLPQETQVIVDANGKRESMELFEACMPGRFRFEELRLADSWFHRAESTRGMYGMNLRQFEAGEKDRAEAHVPNSDDDFGDSEDEMSDVLDDMSENGFTSDEE